MTDEAPMPADPVVTQEEVGAWLTDHCGRGLPYDNAHDLDSALHGAAYTVRQIEGTNKYTVHIGQSGPAATGIRWLLEYVARNEIARHRTPTPAFGDAGSVREVLQASLEFACLTLAFHGRDRGTDRQERMLDDLEAIARKLDAQVRLALAAAPTPDAAASSLPDRFEAWWATYKHRNRDQASYAMKKQIAFDAFEVASLTDATAKVASTSTPADRS